MDKFINFLSVVIALIILIFVGTSVGVWLWGIIAVAVFGLPALTFWQFFGLLILIRILIPLGWNYKKGAKNGKV